MSETKSTIIEKLQANRSALAADGILRLELFGSVARGEAGDESDVDLLAEFDPERVRTLLDIVRLQRKISSMVGAPVDLAERSAVRPRVKRYIEADLVPVF